MKQAKKLCIFLNPVTNLFEQEKKLSCISKSSTEDSKRPIYPSIICIRLSNVSVTVSSCIPIVSPGRRAWFFFFVLIVYNAADFVSVAWRSRSVPTCFTRMRRRNWAEYPFPPRETFFIILIPFNVGRE